MLPEYFRYLKNIIILLLLLPLIGCSNAPEETIKKYLDCTFLGNDGKKAYQLLSSEDQKYTTESEFNADIKRKNVFNEKFLKNHKEYFAYEILEITPLNDDTVKVKVSLTKPNTGNLLEDMLDLAIANSVNKLSDKEKRDMIDNKFGKIADSEEIKVETEEKEFTLIKENDEFKIYMNFGYPQKMELINQEIERMNEEAEESFRKIDFEKAMSIYKKMLSINPSEENYNKVKEMEEILAHTITLNQSITTGNLEIKPKSVELKKVKISKRNWLGELPNETFSTDRFLVLTFDIYNKCEGEVIQAFEANRYKKRHVVHDNFGNEMTEFFLDFDMLSVEGCENKKIGPGEKREMKAVCEAPLANKAGKFIWKMKVFNDNKKTEDFVNISFARKDLSYVEN